MRAEKKVWVAGEALVDLIPAGNEMRAFVGGGPANTARALAALEIDTSFIGGISWDDYGELIFSELDNLDLSFVLRSAKPTATACLVFNSSGSAGYEFSLDGTATFDFRSDWLPTGQPSVLYLGSLAAVIEPGASELFNWASTVECPIVFDPNIRPSLIADPSGYLQKIEAWIGISSVVKLSEDDMNWLGLLEVTSLFDLGVSLVVVTRGENGITGHTPSGSVFVPATKVKVVDTVGAGDTVGAILIEGILRHSLHGLTELNLTEVLKRASRAAAITCTRSGANPPTLCELEQ